MSGDVCVCGHLDVPAHEDGTCRVPSCDCDEFVSEDDPAVADLEEAF